MKIRNGFVSNSSSSSFICDVSGESYVAYDGMSEIDFVECVNGHTFHEDYCLDGWESVRDEESDDYDDDWRYQLPAKFCPICQMKVIDSSDVVAYLQKISGRTREEIEAEIRSKFKDYDALKAFLRA